MTNLEPGKKYFYTAYARNASGTGEGSTLTFTTESGQPRVSTSSSASNIGATYATVSGNIVSDGGFPITSCGICYSSTNRNPTTSDNVVYATAQSGQFSCTLTGLTPSTNYYARAFAQNSSGGGPSYGTSVSFKTTNGKPSVTIAQQPTYSGNNATVYGRITSDGGADITEYGVVVSRITSSPSIDNYEMIANDTGAPISNDFTFTLTNLPTNTMIYYSFYVINSLGKVAHSSSGYVITY